MPGVVNNEDYTLVDITKGIFATNPYQVPDGYSQSLTNFMIRGGIIEQRMAFKVISRAFAANGWASTSVSPIPFGLVNLNVPCNAGFVKLASAWFDPIGAGNRLVGFSTGPTDLSRSPALAQTYLGGLVAYNGTVYASSGMGIVRLDVSNWPVAVGETLVPGGSGVNAVICSQIISHKSRLFGYAFNTNRLRFTDAPSVGALPEAWNPTVNFIDFNGLGVTTIYYIVSLNNYIYVFTNAGLFSLYTTGAPANWVVRNINPDVSIRSPWAVTVRNNLIYYVTDSGVFVTDGFDFKKISQALSEYFNGTIQPDVSNVILQPFDSGLILSINKKNSTAFGLETVERSFLYTKLDSIAWTEFKFPETALTEPNKPMHIWSTEIFYEEAKNFETRFVVAFENAGTGGKTLKSFAFKYRSYVFDSFNKDTMPVTSVADLTGFTSHDMQLELITKPLIGSNFMRLKFFRDAMIILGSRLPCLMTIEGLYNGKWSPVDAVFMQEIPYADVDDLNDSVAQFVKIGLLNQLVLSVQMKFNFTLLWSNDTAKMLNQGGRYAFSLVALGVSNTLERTAPEGNS